MCADAALLLDTAAMLERFSRRDADTKELGRLAVLFCEANASDGEEERGPVEARLWLQECLTLASACQVIASSLPPWRMLTPDGETFVKGSVVAVAEALLEGGGKKPKGKVRWLRLLRSRRQAAPHQLPRASRGSNDRRSKQQRRQRRRQRRLRTDPMKRLVARRRRRRRARHREDPSS